MANCCAYDMRITGGFDEVKELISMLHWQGKGANPGLGRLFSIELDPIEETKVPGVFMVYLSGDCADSVRSSMRDDGVRYPSLESESKRLGLVVEVFSSEPGCEFQEHVLISKGEILANECVSYKEYFVDEYESIEKYNEANGTSFTQDMVNCNGEVIIGGLSNYGDFIDASVFFSPEKVKGPASIDDQIKAAETEKSLKAAAPEVRALENIERE